MTIVVLIITLFWLITTLLHLASLASVAVRLRAERAPVARRASSALVTIVRPVKGIDADLDTALRSGFQLDDAAFELIFCAHSADDPAVAIVRRLMAEHPAVNARLLIGDAPQSGNPKLDNIVKAWPEARGEWIVFGDGNVILPPDYVSRLLAAWTPTSGAVTAMPVGVGPVGFAAEIECAFLNQFQARWLMFTAALGLSFAHGKTMLVRRRDLDSAGGIGALAGELAEDVALTKIVWAQGRRVVTICRPVAQPLGPRRLAAVLQRQARWARLRRAGYPLGFALEICSGGLLPVLAAGMLSSQLVGHASLAMLAQAVLWYGAEWLFASRAGWHVSLLTIPASVARDLSIPLLWVYAWLGGQVRWGDQVVYGRDPT